MVRAASYVNLQLTALDIEERLEDLLGAVLTSRRTAAEPARKLSSLARSQQDFALHWAAVIAKSNSEMAFQFVSHVTGAFSQLDVEGVTQWIIEAMDVYDRDGLYLGSAKLRAIEQFATQLVRSRYAVTFNEVVHIMNTFVTGVAGRNLGIQEAEQPWTDTETLYLPPLIGNFDSHQQNFELYKAMVGYQWAQIRYGTFRMDGRSGIPIVCLELANYKDSNKALEIFSWVEEQRLVHRLAAELPGLARQLKAMKRNSVSQLNLSNSASELKKIQLPGAGVKDSLAAVKVLYDRSFEVPAVEVYQGAIELEQVRLVTKRRVETEREKFRMNLALLAETASESEELEDESSHQVALKVTFAQDSTVEQLSDGDLSFTIDGKPLMPPEDVIQTTKSIMHDFGEIPEDYLVPSGSGLYDAHHQRDEKLEREEAEIKNGVCYDEWDYRRGHYRKNWCVLRESDLHPGNAQQVSAILERYFYLVHEIRKTFEALRGDNRVLRRQKNGDDIDLDAVVESYVDMVKGGELSEQLFIKPRQLERNLAVIFMVDVSGSTKGWINEAERESLVLLSEALETLGDRYAIYGFSGMTRKRCEVYRIKTFDEPYTNQVKARIAGIKPQDYTRMGVVIRHLSEKLKQVDAKTRVLITISDGKPDDYDGYRGEYGIEDTRQALLEAKHAGIYPFCVTIDTHAHEYLPHMYGHVNYTVVSDIRKLPLKVSDIYRKLTT